MIQFENVTKIYQRNHLNSVCALKNVSFKIDEGEFVLIVGKSGAGKTTILKLIAGIVKPTEGNVFFNGWAVNTLKPDELSQLRKKIGMIFQDYKLLDSKTAFENLAYILEVIDVKEDDIEEEVNKVLEIVGLEEKANNFPEELSAGENQRLAIARALILRPKVILADEPTANLDPINTAEILKIFKKLHKMGQTIVLATHNEGVARSLKKRTISIERGEIIKDDLKGRFIL